MSQRNRILEASDKLGAASAKLAGYRAALASSATLTAPAVAQIIQETRTVATQLEVLAIDLAQAKRDAS